MLTRAFLAFGFLAGLLISAPTRSEDVSCTVTLGNELLSRTLTVENGVLRTTELTNKLAKTSWKPASAPEFRLRISQGTECPDEKDAWLDVTDFRCVDSGKKSASSPPSSLPIRMGGGKCVWFELKNQEWGLNVRVSYSLFGLDPFIRKKLEIQSSKPVTLEFIEVDSIPAEDAFQPYQLREITAQAPYHWKPGLGQPLFTTQTATFWGVEFPAALNSASEGSSGDDSGTKILHCAYFCGKKLLPGETLTSWPSVFGVGDDPEFITDAFQDYINSVRACPLRLQVQFNSWFDYGGSVSRETFAQSVRTIHQELVEKRHCEPLSAYVIDSGWERRSDVTETAWPVNSKFDSNFVSTIQAVVEAHSTLGLWLSPGCLFGAKPMVKEYREAGFEALGNSMSLCGPNYMNLLERRLVELTRLGVTFFKFDGLFGHLNTRDFELHGRGCAAMPQLKTEDFSPSDKRLNDSRYDELKIAYLSAGTERLITAFQAMREVNPNVFIVISNGAWLSPWWLQSVDAVWMINAGDAAGGSSRTEELVYRDGIYHSIWKKENTQFPMASLFNHEPKKTSTGEPAEAFRGYLFMHLTRGTAFQELYLKPRVLSESDWDVLAEGVKWAHRIFPAFQRARMHGGDPASGAVYGYSGWEKDGKFGYLSAHNSSAEVRNYQVKLDRSLGMLPTTNSYCVKKIVGAPGDSAARYRFGDTFHFALQPGEIQVLEFEDAAVVKSNP